jgi:hypothetical protein
MNSEVKREDPGCNKFDYKNFYNKQKELKFLEVIFIKYNKYNKYYSFYKKFYFIIL